jgi:hypothetical protein
MNPYNQALAFIKANSYSSAAGALSKCILSLWNENHRFSIAEILQPLDQYNTWLVIDMVRLYATHGETQELLDAGRWVYDHKQDLIEVSNAMSSARSEVIQRWEEEYERKIEEEEREEKRRSHNQRNAA